MNLKDYTCASGDSEDSIKIGVIGGSGLYDFAGLKSAEWSLIETPYGNTSDRFLHGRVNESEVYFLPRHGRGHRLSPTEINYRANIDAFKRAGVKDLISISAVGSLKAELKPGTFVLVDQFIDRTVSRKKTFFDDGLVAHVSLANPTCARLSKEILDAASEVNIPIVQGGTYLAMEGPQFSTRAESNLYRSWDCDVIGMTNMPEAKLAREAEICYSTIAMVTDFDCWHEGHDAVTVTAIQEVMERNSSNAKILLSALLESYVERPDQCPEGCDTALDGAIITPPEYRPLASLEMNAAILERVLDSHVK
jgi:5'-methylthioadenosine phosphorylase